MQNDLTLIIAEAKKCTAIKWKNRVISWSELLAKLRGTTRTDETLKEYFALPVDRQADIKDVGGFVGGKLRGGVYRNKKTSQDVPINDPYGLRRRGHVVNRQIVMLDADFAEGLDVWFDFYAFGIAGAVYSTHKHRPSKPRLRIVIPLSRPVSEDEYEPIARELANWLGIENFDPSTYQASRVMYYPSTAKDGEYFFDSIDAPAADVDEILQELDDWTDPANWKYSTKEKKQTRTPSKTAEDPEAKGGIVGAFCRVYSIERAIGEFLADVYEPADEGRYTYTLGTGANGVVIYDNKFAHSFHASDPAGGGSRNAFDLVRLHKFADLDEGHEGSDILKLPSFKAMQAYAESIKEVKRELIASESVSAEVFDDGQETEKARKKGKQAEWLGELATEGTKGKIRNTIQNVVTILSNDPKLKGCFGYNIFEARETATRATAWDEDEFQYYPRPLKDADDSQLRLYLERNYGVTSKTNIDDALRVVMQENAYHPVKDYLNLCEWDGVERIDSLFVRLFGAPDTPYIRAITRKSLTACVARIYDAGCKFDYVTVIVGEEGIQKSSTLSALGRDWFSDSVTTVIGKEAVESIQGAWIIELGELSGLKRAEVEQVKHFITKREDRFRVAYGKRVEHFPRRCVFFATTNEEDFLQSTTGNRRFWVVNTKGGRGEVLPSDYLTDDTVRQIWAEAKHYYSAGERLYLDAGLEVEARQEQDKHLERDERAGIIAEYLDTLLPANWSKIDLYARRMFLEDKAGGKVVRQQVSTMEIWAECLGKNPEDITRRDSIALGRVMKSMRDWMPNPSAQRLPLYGVQKVYTRKPIL